MTRYLLTLLLTLGVLPVSHAAEKTLANTERFPASSGKKLVVDAASLDLRLRGADVRDIELRTDVHISGVSEERAERWILEHTPYAEDGADRLVITATPGKFGFLGFGLLTARAQLHLVIPTSVVPDLTTTSGNISVRGDFPDAAPMQLRSASGTLEFAGAAHSIDVRTASGDTTIEVVRPLERLFARSSSGDVNLTGGARWTHVDTASGAVRLSNLSGPVEVETSNGKVILRWDRIEPGHTITIRSSSGKVDIVLPADASPRGRLSTTSGSIRSAFPGVVDDQGSAVDLQGTGPVLDVVSISGEILLGQRED